MKSNHEIRKGLINTRFRKSKDIPWLLNDIPFSSNPWVTISDSHEKEHVRNKNETGNQKQKWNWHFRENMIRVSGMKILPPDERMWKTK
jgi:hypothetical protein